MSTHKDDNKTVKVIDGKFEDAEGPVKGQNVEPVYFDVELEKEQLVLWNDKPNAFQFSYMEKELSQVIL